MLSPGAVSFSPPTDYFLPISQCQFDHSDPSSLAAFNASIEGAIARCVSMGPYGYPGMWVEIEMILQSLHEMNQKHSIPFSLYKSVDPTIPSLEALVAMKSQHLGPREIQIFIDLLAKNYFCGTNHLLATLFQNIQLPIGCLDFLDFSGMERGNIIMITPRLTARGIHQLVLEYVEKKRAGDLFCCAPFFIDTLASSLMDFYRSMRRRSVFLICFDSRLTGHISPILAERSEDAVHLLSSDSFPSCIHEVMNRIVDLPFPKKFYFFSQQRQHDNYSCSIFTLNDVRSAIKVWYGEPSDSLFSLFQEVVLREDVSSEVTHVFEVRRTPESMMRMVQSMEYVESSGDAIVSCSKGHIALRDYVGQRSYYCHDFNKNEEKLRNMTSSMKLVKYVQRIFARLNR